MVRRLLVCVWWVASASAWLQAPDLGGRRLALFAMKKEAMKRNDRPKGAGRVRQGKKRSELMRGLIDPPAVATLESRGVSEDDPLLPFVKCIAKAADDRKATRTVAFHVAPLTDIASFVVVTNGRSRPQNDAIAAAVADDAKDDFGREPAHVEGGADGGWTCIDYGDVIVNVMTPVSREFYDIDALWAKADQVDLSDVIVAASDDDALSDDDLFAYDDDDEDDFWDIPNAEGRAADGDDDALGDSDLLTW